jgi:hypothetical protein
MANTILEKVYITKYALTEGIIEKAFAELYADVTAPEISTMIIVRAVQNNTLDMYFHKPDWYLTKEEAVERAEEMKKKQIKALKKKIERLEKLVF